MFVVEIDNSSRFVVLGVAGQVTADEARAAVQRVREISANVEPGFVALVDFRWLDSMDTAAAPFIAEIMDALAAKKVSAVVRVVPDAHKDIGLNILSRFHYGPEIRVMTFETLADAVQSLVA
jgi:anti-anti-sigma regulatory factor